MVDRIDVRLQPLCKGMIRNCWCRQPCGQFTSL